MPTTVTPSRIANTIAGKLWGKPDTQQRIIPGAFWFSTPGHGGAVALVDKLPDVSADVVELGRRHDLIAEYVAYRFRGRTHVAYSGETTSAKHWAKWKAQPALEAATLAKGEVWIGEEDCEWATLAVASPAFYAADVAIKSKQLAAGTDVAAWLAEFGTGQYPREVCGRWYAEWLAEYDALTAARAA